MTIGLRRGKLALPRVNQDPRPPNEPRIGGGHQVGPALYSSWSKAKMGVGPGHPAAGQAPQQPKPPKTPSDPMANQTASLGGGPEKNLFGFSSFTPKKGEADPRDHTYWANLSQLMFKANQDYNKNLLEQRNADTSFSQQLGDMNLDRSRQQRSLGEDAIRSNLSRSGWLNRTDTEQTTDFVRNLSGVNLSKSQEDQARLAARQAILQGFSLDEAAQLAEASANYAKNKAASTAQDAPRYSKKQINKIIRGLLHNKKKKNR